MGHFGGFSINYWKLKDNFQQKSLDFSTLKDHMTQTGNINMDSSQHKVCDYQQLQTFNKRKKGRKE